MLAERQQAKSPPDPAAPGKDGAPELPARAPNALERLRTRMADEPNAKSPTSEPPGRTRERTRDPGRGR